MRILIFHGYLLRGTGSNIYNASLVRALARLGHEVELVCQERRADELDLPDAVHVTVPDIGGVLPVYVADRYEGYDAVPYAELDDAGVERYIDANVRAVREVAERTRPDVALANHLVMGPGDPGPGARGPGPVRGEGPRQRARVHGAAAPRALPALRAGGRARRPGRAGGLAAHRGEPLGGAGRARACPSAPGWARPAWTCTPSGRGRPRRRPPGSGGWPGGSGRARPPSGAERPDAAAALASLDPARDRIVSYVGKLIVSKGVDLLLAAWPLVVARVPGRAARDRGVRHLPRGARPLRGRARAARTWTRCATSRRAGASSRAGRPGALAHLQSFLDRVDEDWLRGRARRRPSACTSPAASSTRTSPTCCPPARRR